MQDLSSHRQERSHILLCFFAGLLLTGGCDSTTHFADGFRVDELYHREAFTQLQPSPADLLWVIDTSCSMVDEQEALATNFPSFIEFFIEREVPFRMGVTSTNVHEQDSDGLDGTLTGSPQWLDSNVIDVEDELVERLLLGIDPDHGDERGLHSSFVAINDGLASDPNFLRPEASLVVLIVSDEPDYSTIGAPDSDQFVDSGTYASWLNELKGGQRAQHSVIVGVSDLGIEDPNGCLHNDFQGQPNLEHGALRGDGYIEAALATGGSVQSICEEDWTSSLYRLGTTSAGLLESFELAALPNVDTIEVRVEGSTSDEWSYEPGLGAVLFQPHSIPEAGEDIVITYQEQVSEPE